MPQKSELDAEIVRRWQHRRSNHLRGVLTMRGLDGRPIRWDSSVPEQHDVLKSLFPQNITNPSTIGHAGELRKCQLAARRVNTC